MKKSVNGQIVDMTAEEISEREAEISANQILKEEREAERTAKENLKTSAKAKLVAGEPLTEDEANTIVL